MARQVAFIGENQTEPYVYGFDVNLYGNDFTFIPKSVYEKGFVLDGKQYYLPGVLNPEFERSFQPYVKPFSVDEVQKIAPNFKSDYEKSAFEDKQGYLVPANLSETYLSKFSFYDIGENKDGFVFGGITGLATNPEGQKYFNVAASGKPNAAATATADGQVLGNWYDPGKEERWYESPLGIVGGLLLVGSGLGLAGIGPLAAGAAGGAAAGGAAAAGGGAAGIGGGALGTGLTAGTTATGIGGGALGTGLTAGTTATGIGGGALGTGLVAGSAAAGAGTSAATGAGLLDGATFAGQGFKVPAINSSQVALIPEGTALAGQGLQVPTLPGLSAMGGGTGLAVGVPGGTVTQLGMVPTGATPVLGDPASFINNPNVLGNTVFSTDYLAAPGAATGMSASDALRLANQAKGLLGAGQNPIVPQQQGLPQGGGGSQGVDYSGLLSLLQLQARTPGVSSLTAPAQLRQIYQPTLLPNVLSLLG
jgi:hypothetical protein